MFARHFNTLFASATVAVALSGCATPPASLDLTLEKPSASGHYAVALVPPPVAPAINQVHSWTVKLRDASGAPVTGAMVTVGGGMPQHGHGFPTRPRVTREVEEGTYLVEGMKFSMPGWWNIKFDIQGVAGDDKVTFNTVVTRGSHR
ncbi:MAG TPA: FixH family protein [Steroidobacteraceae bacterium]|nr:FixH family protein [Steroidobacteraceae bacterium]